MAARQPCRLGEVLEVLVTCMPHAHQLVLFPQVRGFYLAKHLRLSGVKAEFSHLPVGRLECDVLICSEYQQTMDYLERRLAPQLSEVRASRMFCIAEGSLYGQPDHFSRQYCEWFAGKGGVLCQLPTDTLEPFEHWIGVGVDVDVVSRPAGGARDRILFDFPRSSSEDASGNFDVTKLDTIRERLPDMQLVGSGPSDAPIRAAFDQWVSYGQPYQAYVSATFPNLLAFVPGWEESLGLPIAEAQVAGACIVSSEWQVHDWMLCAEAAISYVPHEPVSLAAALQEARMRDARIISDQATAKFDFTAVATRTRAAIGL
jgi:hypothetical protein